MKKNSVKESQKRIIIQKLIETLDVINLLVWCNVATKFSRKLVIEERWMRMAVIPEGFLTDRDSPPLRESFHPSSGLNYAPEVERPKGDLSEEFESNYSALHTLHSHVVDPDTGGRDLKEIFMIINQCYGKLD